MRRILMGVTVTAVFLTGVGVFGEDSTSTYKDSLFLTLEDAQKISMEQNQTILIAKERLIEKQAGIGTARAGYRFREVIQGLVKFLHSLWLFLNIHLLHWVFMTY